MSFKRYTILLLWLIILRLEDKVEVINNKVKTRRNETKPIIGVFLGLKRSLFIFLSTLLLEIIKPFCYDDSLLSC